MVPGMASQALDHSPEDSWSDDEWVENLLRIVNTLMALRQTTPDALADGIAMGRSTLYGKLKTRKFSGLELVRLGRALDVPPSVFYTPADDIARASDVNAGLIAPTELRPKIQMIWDNAKLAEDPEVVDAGQDMLAAVTAGDDDALAAAVTRFGNACGDHPM